MASLFELPEHPELRDPFMVMHLTGWTDAGLAGETASEFLRSAWNAERLVEFDADELLDFRARRPVVRIANGLVESVTWTGIELWLAKGEPGQRDALLLTGPEPDFRWRGFCDEVVRACTELGVSEVYGLGAFPAPAVHTDPVQIIGTSADPELATRLTVVPAIVELSAGVQTMLEHRLHKAGFPTLGIWARVPPYLAGGAHPPAALALVRTLILLSGLDIETTELEMAAAEHLEQVDMAVQERPQIAELIEQIRSVAGDEEPGMGVPSGDEIAAELERFLSQQPPPGESDDPDR
jgi:proteasome assembly chaperone (PAC2) family protein